MRVKRGDQSWANADWTEPNTSQTRVQKKIRNASPHYDFWCLTRARHESNRVKQSQTMSRIPSKSRQQCRAKRPTWIEELQRVRCFGWNAILGFGAKLSSQGRVKQVFCRSLFLEATSGNLSYLCHCNSGRGNSVPWCCAGQDKLS